MSNYIQCDGCHVTTSLGNPSYEAFAPLVERGWLIIIAAGDIDVHLCDTCAHALCGLEFRVERDDGLHVVRLGDLLS